MPLILAFLAALGEAILPLAIRLLVGLGLSFVTYLGVSTLWDSVQTQFSSYMSGLSGSILTILGMARVDDMIQVVLSAGTAKLVLKGLNAATGGLKFLKWG